jgi:hypothetical protein
MRATDMFWHVVLGQLRETIWSGVYGWTNVVPTVTYDHREGNPPYVLLTTGTFLLLCAADFQWTDHHGLVCFLQGNLHS